MKTMLGFFGCCAAAGMLATVTATNEANELSQMLLITRIISGPSRGHETPR